MDIQDGQDNEKEGMEIFILHTLFIEVLIIDLAKKCQA
jgi:hypothetical protein